MSQSIDPPEGWTTDPEELDYEYEWAAEDGQGQELTRDYRLGKGQPIMVHPENCRVMFKAGEKFYFWDRIDWGVWEILSKDLDEIITIMKEKGEKHLKVKQAAGL